jgi:uncharacterized protein (TIGR02246 family)
MTTSSPTATFPGPSPADQAAIWALPQRLVAAWAQQDADAFAAIFHEDGTMILPGLYRTGREEIRSFMAGAFAGPYRDTQVTGQPINIKFINDEVVVLITQGGVLQPGERTVSDARAIRATWLVVKRDGRWLLSTYQNSPSIAA